LLLTATLCLLAFGAVMVFSASSARSLLTAAATASTTSSGLWSSVRIGLAVMRIASMRGVAAARVMTPLILVSRSSCSWSVLMPGRRHGR
jgi:cell division protein FtsW